MEGNSFGGKYLDNASTLEKDIVKDFGQFSHFASCDTI